MIEDELLVKALYIIDVAMTIEVAICKILDLRSDLVTCSSVSKQANGQNMNIT
jgi:hypothetical protein